jgi:hypothetical protein
MSRSLLLLAVLAAQQLSLTMTPTGTAAVSGVVIDAVTKQPVAGASVSLRSTGDRSIQLPRMVTDEDGRFVFINLPASDSYFLDASAGLQGYASTRWGWAAPDGPLTLRDMALVSLRGGQWVNDITIPLWKLGSIEGRIVDERGEPVVGTAVRSFSQAMISGRVRMVAGPVVTTDDRGAYRITGLKPGRHYVAALSVQSTVLDSTPEEPAMLALGQLATGGIGGSRGAPVRGPTIDVDGDHRLALTQFATPPPPNADAPRVYPPVYYPGAPTIAQARPIEIGYGDARTGIDLSLVPVPAVRVSGRVVSPLGPPPQFLLRLLPAGSEHLGFGSEVATTVVDQDGTFTFLNVPAGSYTLLAQAHVMDFTSGSAHDRVPDAPGFPGGGISVGSADGAPGLGYLTRSGEGAQVWGRESVSVGQVDIADLVVNLRRTVSLRGQFAFAEGMETPDPDDRLEVRLAPANGDPSLGQFYGRMKRGDPTFQFTAEGLLGGRHLLTVLTGQQLVSVTWRGIDVTDTGFDAGEGHDFDDVVVTVTDKDTGISGTVTGTIGPGVAAVIAFPFDRSRWTDYGWRPRHFRTARAGTNGRYEITSLPAGEYYLVAVSAAHRDAWSNPEFLAIAAGLAQRLSLAWGDRATVDLRFSEVPVR